MAIILPGGFNITNNEAVDARFSLASESARFALSSANIYEGLVVYQRDTNTLWVLVDTTNVANVNGWEQIPLANAGTFQVYPTYADLTAVYANYFTNGQIVYVVDTNTLYKASVTYANMVTTFTDSITWNTYEFSAASGSVVASSGLNSSYSNKVTTISLDTGSAHFTNAVEYVISSGSFMIDCGII